MIVIRAITSIIIKVTVAPTNAIVSTHKDSVGTLFVLIITSCGPRKDASGIVPDLLISSSMSSISSSSASVGRWNCTSFGAITCH